MTVDGEGPQSEIGQLAMAVRAGQKGAEAKLVEQLSRPLRLMCRMRRLSPADADDVTQDVLLIIIERLRSDAPIKFDSLPAYAQSTFNNVLIADRRKAAKRAELIEQFQDSLIPKARPEPEQSLDKSQTTAAVSSAIEALTQERDRVLLREHYLLELDKDELCQKHGVSERHFDRIVFNARRRLVSQLRKEASL